MRVVFMGTPPFAADILRRVHGFDLAEVVGVYCQPDRPAGRGHRLTPPAVKVLAQELGLAVHQPLHFKEQADRDELAALRPDVLVVAAYGLILPQAVLDIPGLGPWNVHASLLPRHRGAAPIERAVMAGETQTGVTIMRMEAGLDTGPMALQRALAIGMYDTAASLLPELSRLGADLLLEVLDGLARHEPPVLIEQDDARSTYAAKLTRADGDVDFRGTVWAVHAHVRGVTPRPGARAVLCRDGETPVDLCLLPGVPHKGDTQGTAGTMLALQRVDGRVVLPVVCADGLYFVSELRPANGKTMSAEAFVNGYAPELRAGSTSVLRLGLSGENMTVY